MTTLYLKKSICRSPLRLAFLLISLSLTLFALSPTARAVTPAPDGGYANENTAEGTNALFSLTTGDHNTANGFEALFHNTTGGANTATGHNTLQNNTTGSHNTANGGSVLASNTTGSENTASGRHALQSNTIGSANTASGSSALSLNTTGFDNTADGFGALASNTTGTENTASGFEALLNNTTGAGNVALGFQSGGNLTTGHNNIDVGNTGVATDAATIRIGTAKIQTKTFIAGINGTTASGGVAVFVNSAGQLGTITSSARFKEAIKPMDKASEAILQLKPVTFRYKQELDPDGIPQFGLVAEEVEKVNPDLVARDEEGKVNTVRYEAVNAMLLNEFLKEHRTVQELKATAAMQEATIARQQKQIEALTATVQKVSDQVALSKPVLQLVTNP